MTELVDVDMARFQESERIWRETGRERKWWGKENKFLTMEDALKALDQGVLVTVPPENENYRVVSRLSLVEGEHVPLLRPVAYDFLVYSLSLWRELLGGEDKSVRLAVTSLYRPKSVQEKIKNSGKGYRAVGSEESSHLAGTAFDISCRSFYLVEGGEVKKVQKWDPNTSVFNGKLFTVLSGVFEELEKEGKCNFVIESKIDEEGIEPSVYHVCVSPSFRM